MAQHKSNLGLIHYTSQLQLTQPTAVAIGNFDGAHLGHQALLQRLNEKSRALGLHSIVCTFEPLPEEFFSRPIQRLTNLRTKAHLLAQHSVQKLLIIHFQKDFSRMSATDFIQNFLVNQLRTAYLITGKDFKFGRQREGGVSDLMEGRKLFEYEVMPDYLYKGKRVSSTFIRQLLSRYQLTEAAAYLGKPYSLYARITQGKGIGSAQLGIPTANLNLKKFIPCIKGVFACRAFLNTLNTVEAYPAVANLGVRPTTDGTQFVAEAHLFDFNQNIKNETLQLQFISHLREEKKFKSIPELAAQIKQDKEKAAQILS